MLIDLGDHADMPSLCSYDAGKKGFSDRSILADLEAARAGMVRLLTPLWDYNDKARKNHEKLYEPEMHLMLGNHEERIVRALEMDAKLEGLVSLEALGYEEFGWTVHPFLHPVVVDGVCYSHYFPSGPKGLPIGSAAKLLHDKHMSCVAGHQQGRQMAGPVTRADGKRMMAIIAGSFYQHDETYMPYPSNWHWRGIYMLHEVEDGEFDEMAVSLDYLALKAEKEGWK